MTGFSRAPPNLDIYVCERSEQGNNPDYLKLKKKKKTATKNNSGCQNHIENFDLANPLVEPSSAADECGSFQGSLAGR